MIRSLQWALALTGLCAVTAQAAEARDLVVGVQEVRARFDPGMETGNTAFPLTNAMFDTLIRRDFKSDERGTGTELKPGLAESWQRVDELTLELKLREGLSFHNGEALTSEDVKFSFDRMLDPDSRYSRSRFQFGNIDRVETVDDLTVRIITKTPDPVIEKMLFFPGASIVPKDYYQEVGFEAFGQNPIGTGPYVFVRSIDDDRTILAANEDYWMGRPPVDQLVFREIPEISARITALANGEVGLINNVPPDQLSAIERLSCCDVKSVMVNSHVLNYRTSNPIMADKRFRQGLNLAIDRELLSRALWNGKAVVPRGHQYEEWGKLYNAERPVLAHDPERARKLIAELGYAGQPIQFITHPVYYTNGLPAAEAIVSMWQDVGVNAELQVSENWYKISNDEADIEVRNLSDWLVVPDPHATIVWSWTVTALWEGNEDFQTLGKKAAATLDANERYRLYQQMQDIWIEEAPGTVLYRAPEFYGVRNNIIWTPYSVYLMDFRPDNLSFKD
ncbi:ABC transporter substrate-binding protein [Algihabitans albus]|uniref:ABC transporter substrate-binding protein n=1 Tax=Algihabitans albus TaxID=2164067 RepID=UPI0035D090DE